SGALRSAYKLTYDQAPLSNASRLTAVTRYGTDAAIAADGTISGGTAKPLGQMTYQNTDGLYTSVNSALAGAPNETGDLDFDGRDEIFGDGINKSQNSGGHDGSPTNVWTRTKHIYKFNSDGTPIGTISLQLDSISKPVDGIDYTPKYFSRPGRFLSTKNTMDFATAVTSSSFNGATGAITYSTTRSIVQTTPQLSMTKVGCAPAGYEAVCAAIPASAAGAFVADADGDGIDTLDKGGSPFGVGDFLGNGRQQPIYRSGDSSVKKGVFSVDKWQPGGTSFDITTGPCVLADINGDGATDIVHYNQGGSTRVFLSTGIGFKGYVKHDADGDIGILRDFDNDGRMDLITLSNSDLQTQPYSTGTVKIYFLQPSSTDFTPVRFYLPVAMTAGSPVGDFNGDGLPDFTDYHDHMFISAPGAGNPNLLRSVVTELGGTIAVEYAPS
ncbi:VCBS repeat-containing protein, partial [Mesorhizobium sp. M0816]|uniref:FG-GAP repeat domain-containing protein n=1 Tax=Mesorhizobium sp. M0816 TaxID=2957006 RepID=UPI0033359C47